MDQELKDLLLRVLAPADGEIPEEVTEALQHEGIMIWKHFAYFDAKETGFTKQGSRGSPSIRMVETIYDGIFKDDKLQGRQW